jgi:hypothetical protein
MLMSPTSASGALCYAQKILKNEKLLHSDNILMIGFAMTRKRSQRFSANDFFYEAAQ